MTRDKRQEQVINLWAVKGYRGCLEAVTGFGKTRVAINGIKRLKSKSLIKSVIITVPTIPLKEQWEALIKENLLHYFTKVVVNNTAANQAGESSCDLLICDEVHTVPTETRGIIMDIPHKFFLGLSATIERQDGNHQDILEKYPIFDSVTFEECIKHGWISPYKIYNVPIDMEPTLMAEYEKANKSFRRAASRISMYNRDTLRQAQEWLSSDNKEEKAMAAIYYNSMRKRKTLCINNPDKIEAVSKIVSLFPDRYGMVFSQSVDFADEITRTIGKEKAITFHSKLTKKVQKEILADFVGKQSGKKIISTVQALDAGFDFPELSLAVIAAGYSSSLTNIQRVGRTVRAVEGKEAIIVNLYSKGTQEESWLANRQKGSTVQYLSSINDLIDLYEVRSGISAH
jgi:superfamily II DNA or RNA helicase